ncbi:MAG: CHAT domain-containing protein [Chloroflexi bacterium]|nr:CHAT domain-containing protein [Chloroflexota bacterium]
MQTRLLGDTFKKLARKETLNIQIFSQEFTLPWGLLYIGDDPDNPEPEHFLGLKHVIEHIPLQPQMQVTDRAINTTKGIQVALNVNKDIDDQMGQPIIQRQIDEWQKLSQGNSNIRVEVRSDAVDVMTALNDGEAVDQILYFYCHAESYNLDEMDKGGADMSRLIMTGHEDLTLRRMSRNRTSLAGQPLVFINACESAELSPEFYDGFVPYFVSKGARGVIGTECETPALFAEEWAKRFFPRFLAGQPLGQIFLDLRREFYNNHNNIMGLLYALYVDGDTYVSNPLMS